MHMCSDNRRRRHFVFLDQIGAISCLILFLCVPSLLSAQRPILDVELSTDAPISMGFNTTVTYANGLRMSSGLGYLPHGYVALINDVVQSFPYSYDEDTGQLIEETLKDSLVWRTHIGWQTQFGLYMDVGYGLAALGGGTSTEALIAGLSGYQAPNFSPSSNNYAVGSVLHLVDCEVGWKTLIGKRWTFRTSLGVAATFAASASVKAESIPNSRARQRLIEEFEAFSESYLENIYTEYVITPILTLAIGYRIF